MIKIGILINLVLVIFEFISYRFWKYESLNKCIYDNTIDKNNFSDEEKHLMTLALNSIDENLLYLILIVSIFLPYLWVLFLIKKIYREII